MITLDDKPPLRLFLKVLLFLFVVSFIVFLFSVKNKKVIKLPVEEVQLEVVGHRIITAYNPTEAQTDSSPCISASGLNVCEADKLICACPREFPFGTKFLIDDKVYHCEDRLSEKYDHRIDILMIDYKEAKEWGKQNLLVQIIK